MFLYYLTILSFYKFFHNYNIQILLYDIDHDFLLDLLLFLLFQL